MKIPAVKRYTLKEVEALIVNTEIEGLPWEKWHLVNNIIDDVEIVCLGHFGAMLTLELKMRKHWNVFGLCNATANCGLILRELAIFFDVVEEDGSDVIDALRGQPCRVLELFTAQIVKPEHTFIGRFMDDSFIWAADLAKLGFDEGGK